jgi:hypothetical protein
MPIDWGSLISTGASLIPKVIGATAGTQAVSNAAGQNKADLEAAYNKAVGAYTGASKQAGDIYNWGMNQQIPIAGWGYQQGRSDQLNALTSGQQALAGGQENIASMLSPYTGAGIRGSSGTNFLLHGAGSPGGQSSPMSSMQPTGRSGFPTGGNEFGNIPTFSVAPNPSSGFNALTSGGAGGPGGISSFNPTEHVDPGSGGLAGAIAGGAGMAALGPLGAVAGPLIGSLMSKLTQRGREKRAASSEANDFSDWVWKEAVPQAKSQGMNPDQLHQVVQAGWDQYKNWLNSNLHNQGVINNSEQSQLGYLNQGSPAFGAIT